MKMENILLFGNEKIDLSRIFLEVVSSTLNLIADFFCGLPSLSLYKAFNLVFIEMTLF